MNDLDENTCCDLDIVIVSYNNSDLLRKTLLSIPPACGDIEYHVTVVDNASGDDSVEMVRTEFQGVKLIALSENIGFARANNVVLEKSNSRYALLLNPDTEALAGAIEEMVRFMDEHSDAGVVGPKLMNSDGSLQHNGRLFPTVKREFLAVSGLRKLNLRGFDLKHHFGRSDFDKTCEVDEVSGACLMVRREVLQQTGVLDPDFFMFYEEIEFCWRVKQKGWKVYYLAEAVVTHHWMGSVKLVSKKMTDTLFRSQLQYYKKTAGPISVSLIWCIMQIGLLKNATLHLGVAIKRQMRKMGLIKAKQA